MWAFRISLKLLSLHYYFLKEGKFVKTERTESQINNAVDLVHKVADHLRKGDIYKAYENYAIALEKGMFTLSKTELESIQRKNLVFGRKILAEAKK